MIVNLNVLGLDHITSSLDLREHIAFHKDNMEEGLRQFNSIANVDSGIILSTCNRLELYYLGSADAQRITHWLAEFHHTAPALNIGSCSYYHSGKEAMQHLLKISCGLRSMALGETQVLGQIKDAYTYSKELGYLSKELDSLFQFAFSVAKKGRSRTNIGRNSVSLASTTVDLAERLLGGLKEKNAMVIGAGNNARLIIEHLRTKGIGTIYIANRTYKKAAELAAKLQGEAVPLIDISKYLTQVNCLFTSTSSPTILVGKGMVEDAVRKWGRRPFVISDMSVPHDVEDSVKEIDQVQLYNLGDVETLLKNNSILKQEEAEKVIKIIDQEISFRIKEEINSTADIKAYRRKVDDIKRAELAQLIDKSVDDKTKEKLISLADSLTAKLSHGPTTMMKEIYKKEDIKSIEQVRRNLLD